MILDFSANWKMYAKNNETIWKEAFGFIDSLNIDAEEKKYFIRGDDFFAFVQLSSRREEGSTHWPFQHICFFTGLSLPMQQPLQPLSPQS